MLSIIYLAWENWPNQSWNWWLYNQVRCLELWDHSGTFLTLQRTMEYIIHDWV